MTRISGKRISEEYLRQDFYPYVKSNGQAVMVSDDRRYYYVPLT